MIIPKDDPLRIGHSYGLTAEGKDPCGLFAKNLVYYWEKDGLRDWFAFYGCHGGQGSFKFKIKFIH